MILVAPYSFNFSEHLGAWAPIKSSSALAHKDLCHESSSVLQLSPRSSTDDFFSQKTCSHQQIISFKKGPNHLLGYPALFWPTLRFLKDRITTKYKQRHMTKTKTLFKSSFKRCLVWLSRSEKKDDQNSYQVRNDNFSLWSWVLAIDFVIACNCVFQLTWRISPGMHFGCGGRNGHKEWTQRHPQR